MLLWLKQMHSLVITVMVHLKTSDLHRVDVQNMDLLIYMLIEHTIDNFLGLLVKTAFSSETCYASQFRVGVVYARTIIVKWFN